MIHVLRSDVLRRHDLRPLCLTVVGLLAVLAATGASWDSAEARPRQRAQRQQVVTPRTDFGPRYADIVVDTNSGEVLHEAKPDELRHPASLTKIMTLYLLFEQLEAGKVKLDMPMPVSAEASRQHPVKLGLKPGQTITVEEGIKALVTKSANDAAVVIAEALAGTEEEFAKLMTRKAKMLGMANTIYINASGLPAEEQVTTAREQALLGRAIQDRFPDHYRYFATASFQFRGREIGNHNALLKTVNGVDGIKTGYTDASGYNLVSSLRRDNKHLVAVVLGGSSNGARDARMRALLEQSITTASKERTAPKIVEVALPEDYQDFVPTRTAKSADTVPVPVARTESSAPTTAAALASAKTLQAHAPKPAAVNRRHAHRTRSAAR
jgi:D-alanyl-D-alanine carboxypeptidase